ncbi:unnamed protein product [Aphanomyces euteiches]
MVVAAVRAVVATVALSSHADARADGVLGLVDLAPEKPISFRAFSLVPRQIAFVGSLIGPPSQIEEMLSFAVDKGVNSIVEVMPMAEAVGALQKVHDGQARFRIVLKN